MTVSAKLLYSNSGMSFKNDFSTIVPKRLHFYYQFIKTISVYLDEKTRENGFYCCCLYNNG